MITVDELSFVEAPTPIRELLRVGWSPHELARRLGVNARTAERWCSGALEAPDRVVAWLGRVGDAVEGAGMPDGWER